MKTSVKIVLAAELLHKSTHSVSLLLQLYTQDFYEKVVKPKLNPDGIFVTQSGPAGVLSCTEVCTAINCTLRSVFSSVQAYTQHIPSYVDEWVSCCHDLHAGCIFAEMSAFCRGAACSCLLSDCTGRNFEIVRQLPPGYHHPLMQSAGACRAGTWPLTAL